MMDMAEDASNELSSEPSYDRARYIAWLFDENFVSLRHLAFALVGDATVAEELAQEAFVRLYASWRRLDQLDHAPTFLRRIVVNLCRSRSRRLAVSQRINPLLRGPSSVNQPDVGLRLDVWSALRSLPQGQRACAVLHYLEDLTESQTAELLGCSVGSVKSQLHKA